MGQEKGISADMTQSDKTFMSQPSHILFLFGCTEFGKSFGIKGWIEGDDFPNRVMVGKLVA